MTRTYKLWETQNFHELLESITKMDITRTLVRKAIDRVDHELFDSGGRYGLYNLIRNVAKNSGERGHKVTYDYATVIAEAKANLENGLFIDPDFIVRHIEDYSARKRCHKLVISTRTVKAVLREIQFAVEKILREFVKGEEKKSADKSAKDEVGED